MTTKEDELKVLVKKVAKAKSDHPALSVSEVGGKLRWYSPDDSMQSIRATTVINN